MPPESSIIKTKIRNEFGLLPGPDKPRWQIHGVLHSNDMGRYKVHVVNTETGKKKVFCAADSEPIQFLPMNRCPLLAWDPAGERLAIIRDRGPKYCYYFYDLEKRKTEINPVRKFQKVVSFNFVDSKQLVMSAMQNGQTDIFLYTIASTTTRKINR